MVLALVANGIKLNRSPESKASINKYNAFFKFSILFLSILPDVS